MHAHVKQWFTDKTGLDDNWATNFVQQGPAVDDVAHVHPFATQLVQAHFPLVFGSTVTYTGNLRNFRVTASTVDEDFYMHVRMCDESGCA